MPDDVEDALRDRHRRGQIGVGADHDELVAADAADDVARPHAQTKAIREVAQHVVTGRVSETVIDGLERVDVEEQRQPVARPPGETPAIAASRLCCSSCRLASPVS